MVFLISKKETDLDDIIQMEATCNMSQIPTDDNILVIADVTISQEGVVNELQFSLDEVLMSGKFKLVITKNRIEKLEEICSFYKVPLLEL